MVEGTLEIDLKDTEIKVEQPKTWIAKIVQAVTGPKQYEKEVVTQLQYLENIWKIFNDLGLNNIVSLELNGTVVYEDMENTPDDFRQAIELALKENVEEAYHIRIELRAEADEERVIINMYNTHKSGEMPLIIDVNFDRSSESVEGFLKTVKERIEQKFQVEGGEIYVDEEEDFEEEETEQ